MSIVYHECLRIQFVSVVGVDAYEDIWRTGENHLEDKPFPE